MKTNCLVRHLKSQFINGLSDTIKKTNFYGNMNDIIIKHIYLNTCKPTEHKLYIKIASKILEVI